jgi:hypothetical protein
MQGISRAESDSSALLHYHRRSIALPYLPERRLEKPTRTIIDCALLGLDIRTALPQRQTL